jgi:membrane protease YdiL (CAAX protease family)
MWKGVDVLIMSLAIVAGIGVGAAALIAPSALSGDAPAPGQAPSPLFMTGLAAIQAAAMLVAVWLLGLKRRNYRWADLGLVPTSSRWIAIAFAVFVIFRLAVIPIAALLDQLGIRSMQAQALAPGVSELPAALLMLLMVGIAVPIAEEIFFRGVVYRWLRDKWGVTVGAVVSGIIFGLAHLEPASVIFTILLGIVLAVVYERSRSLWPPILIHVLNNAFALVLLYVLIATGVPIPGVN